MFHIFTFIIFYGLILLFGRGTVLFFNKSLNKNNSNEKTLFNIPIHYFYAIIGLFYVGNLTFILNFFINTNSLIYQGLLLSIILFNFLQRIKVRFDFLSLFNFILLPSILAISTIEMGLAYDAGLYHLNNQLWIRESNLPIGFTIFITGMGFLQLLNIFRQIFG